MTSLLGWTLLVFLGCGYRAVMPGGPSSPAADDSGRGRPIRLAVLAIRNESPDPWLDRIVGDALRREVEQRGGLDLVADPSQAEVVLRGRIRPLVTLSNSFSSFVAALEYAVTMQLDLEVVRASGMIVRLDPATLSETELYLASEDIEITRTNRLEALRHLSDVLASRIADSIEMMPMQIPVEPDEPSVSPAGSQQGSNDALLSTGVAG